MNGAGKTTLYQSMPRLQSMPRVNLDDILKEFGDWRNMTDTIRAGRISVERINQHFLKGESFHQETTLCGKTILKNIRKAKELGYYVELHYVGVDTAEIAKERVRERVARGGHGIPEKDIERRYTESLQNLKVILPVCNLTACYDNTEYFRRFAIFRCGVPARISLHTPKWFADEYGGCGI